MNFRTGPTLFLFLSLVLAGCNAPSAGLDTPAAGPIEPQAVEGGQGGGGGRVENSPPAVDSFSADKTSGDNGGAFTVVLSGVLSDPNAERDLASLRVNASGPAILASPVAAVEHSQIKKDEPTDFDANGFKFWDATKNDGKVDFRYRYTFPAFAPAGTYTFRATVLDAASANATSAAVQVVITKFSLITVASSPVGPSGAPVTGSGWGGWSAAPGASGVASTNYIKLTNDGDKPDVRVIVDFTESSFIGQTDANFSIPLSGNVRFAWWEDTSPAQTAPSEGTYAFGSASAEGSVTLQFSGKGNVIYVAYQLAELPAILPKQSYTAAFTVTEL